MGTTSESNPLISDIRTVNSNLGLHVKIRRPRTWARDILMGMGQWLNFTHIMVFMPKKFQGKSPSGLVLMVLGSLTWDKGFLQLMGLAKDLSDLEKLPRPMG